MNMSGCGQCRAKWGVGGYRQYVYMDGYGQYISGCGQGQHVCSECFYSQVDGVMMGVVKKLCGCGQVYVSFPDREIFYCPKENQWYRIWNMEYTRYPQL